MSSIITPILEFWLAHINFCLSKSENLQCFHNRFVIRFSFFRHNFLRKKRKRREFLHFQRFNGNFIRFYRCFYVFVKYRLFCICVSYRPYERQFRTKCRFVAFGRRMPVSNVALASVLVFILGGSHVFRAASLTLSPVKAKPLDFYDFPLIHFSFPPSYDTGKSNLNADLLSRFRPAEVHRRSIYAVKRTQNRRLIQTIIRFPSRLGFCLYDA